MKKSIAILFCLTLILSFFSVRAEDEGETDADPFSISEDEMFSDSKTVKDVDEFKDDRITDKFDKGAVGFSGELEGTARYSFATDKAREDDSIYGRDDAYSTVIDGDLLFDARWKYGLKFFSDICVVYTPIEETGYDGDLSPYEDEDDEENYDITIREVFGDVNIAQKIYFRIGKQTLKWGRGYFWNPTDLISADKKDFNDIEARREGSYGMKIQVPFGAWLNIYAFIDATDTDEYEDSAFAAKVEFLPLENTEISLSGWTKKEYKPVYGFDFSTYIFDTQWRGEVSYSRGGNQHYLVEENGLWIDSYDPHEAIVQSSFGFTMKFDVGDITDRLFLTGEFLVNPKGYNKNMLKRSPLILSNGWTIPEITLRELFLSEYYTPNYYGKRYAALFISFSHLLDTSDLSCSFNAVSNISDGSSVTAANLKYALTFDTTLIFTITGYNGAEDREFTWLGNKGGVEASFTTEF